MNKMKTEEMFAPAGIRRILDAVNRKYGYSLNFRIDDSGVRMDGDTARVRLRADVAASGKDIGKLRRAFGL